MMYPFESINVGHCLRTSRALNNGIIFTRAVKVRRTSTFPGCRRKRIGCIKIIDRLFFNWYITIISSEMECNSSKKSLRRVEK